MTLNARTIWNFLVSHYGQELSKQEIASGSGVNNISAVAMSLRPHVNAGRVVERVEENVVVNDKGKEEVKKTYFYTLTEDGLAYDPEAAEAERKAKAAADTAARRAARKAAKAAEM